LTNFHKIYILQSIIHNQQSSINDQPGGDADISSLSREKAWGQKETFVNIGKVKPPARRAGLPGEEVSFILYLPWLGLIESTAPTRRVYGHVPANDKDSPPEHMANH
jgi:hypothetical protein